MEQSESQYQSYLLRLWRDGEEKAYLAMLEHVDSHERFGFGNMESLCAFLREHASEQCNKNTVEPVKEL